jgi:8-oxo-dGTP diphosphatase
MIKVTCAIIRNDENQVLVVQRGEKTDHPMKWEFPGGKVMQGESEEECIIREVREELSMDIVICDRLENVRHDYGTKQILLIPFVCDTLDELPVLNEHVSFRWIFSEELQGVDFSEADIPVATDYVKKFGSPSSNNRPLSDLQPEIPIDEELKDMVITISGMKNAEWVARSAVENPEIFSKMLEFSYSDDKKLAFHSSWIVTKACDSFPELIFPFLPGIIETLGKMDNESAVRSFLRTISLTSLDGLSEREHGLLAEYCFSALKSGFTAVAIKAYSMEIMYKLTLIYPELSNELAATINMLQGEGSAGIIARGRMVMKKLTEITKK